MRRLGVVSGICLNRIQKAKVRDRFRHTAKWPVDTSRFEETLCVYLKPKSIVLNSACFRHRKGSQTVPMTSKLPINLNALLRQRRVEGERIEYKAGWNPDAIIRTLCAFANDFENLGGGYVVIGQDCNDDGTAIFPPVGLQESQLDLIQRELLQYCQMIQPTYFPVLSVEQVEGRHLIVLWAPGGLNRPYKAPRAVTAKHKEYHYFIRRYTSTVELKSNSEDEQELLRLTATVPFDDRQCQRADVDALRLPMIRLYLKEVGSDLAGQTNQMPFVDLCRQMNIVDGADEFLKPRNVGLLFFNEDPTRFMPGSQIEVVIFPTGPGGDELIEKTFHGPIHEQRYRNRRIGEFLKELDLTEGRCTGIPKIRAAMDRNGSPEPRFSTDEGRTHFLVELPVHPEFVGMMEYAELDVELAETELGILRFLSDGPRRRIEIAEFLGIERRSGSIARALATLLANELAELTIPEKPTSRNQEYRITEKGRAYAERH